MKSNSPVLSTVRPSSRLDADTRNQHKEEPWLNGCQLLSEGEGVSSLDNFLLAAGTISGFGVPTEL